MDEGYKVKKRRMMKKQDEKKEETKWKGERHKDEEQTQRDGE